MQVQCRMDMCTCPSYCIWCNVCAYVASVTLMSDGGGGVGGMWVASVLLSPFCFSLPTMFCKTVNVF